MSRQGSSSLYGPGLILRSRVGLRACREAGSLRSVVFMFVFELVVVVFVVEESGDVPLWKSWLMLRGWSATLGLEKSAHRGMVTAHSQSR